MRRFRYSLTASTWMLSTSCRKNSWSITLFISSPVRE